MAHLQRRPYIDSLSLFNKLQRAAWQLVSSLFFFPGPLFNSWRIFLLRLWGAQIGKGCKIRASVKIWWPGNMVLGDYVALGPKVILYNVAPIRIGDMVTVSQYAHLCTASHDISFLGKPLITSEVYINSFSWIAADAFIGMGVTIGEGAVVGACAVVTKDVDAWTVVVGNPARFVKQRVVEDIVP